MPNFAVLYYDPSGPSRKFIPGPEANQTFLADSADDANALAALQEGHGGKFVSFNLSGATVTEETLRRAADSIPAAW